MMHGFHVKFGFDIRDLYVGVYWTTSDKPVYRVFLVFITLYVRFSWFWY